MIVDTSFSGLADRYDQVERGELDAFQWRTDEEDDASIVVHVKFVRPGDAGDDPTTNDMPILRALNLGIEPEELVKEKISRRAAAVIANRMRKEIENIQQTDIEQ